MPPMRRAEIEKLAESVRALLSDPDAGLNEHERRRWEGALAALEAALGQPSSLVDNFPPLRGYTGRTRAYPVVWPLKCGFRPRSAQR